MQTKVIIEEFNSKFKSINVEFEDSSYKLYSFGLIKEYKGQFPFQPESFIKDFEKGKETVFKNINGSFLLVLVDKVKTEIYIVTDQFGDQSIFYTLNRDTLAVSNSIWKLSNDLENLDFDPFGVNQFLEFSHYLESTTLFKNIKKLEAGCFIKANQDSFSVKTYHTYLVIPDKFENISVNEIINEIDYLFDNAIKMQFGIDKYLGSKTSYGFLSGGMDSRNMLLTAKKLGFNIHALSFGSKNTNDIIIAQKITNKNNIKHSIVHTDPKDFAPNFLECIDTSQGLSSIEHLIDGVIPTLILSQFNQGIINSGQIGATIGGRNCNSKKIEEIFKKYTHSNPARKRTTDFLYFPFYNQSLNGDLIGNKMTKYKSFSYSPYQDLHFSNYCLSIPNEIKTNRKLYLKWIIDKKPEQAKFIWTRTLLDLPKSYNLLHGSKKHRIERRINRRIYPEKMLKNWDTWSNNKQLKISIESILTENKALLEVVESLLFEPITSTSNIKYQLRLITLILTYKFMKNERDLSLNENLKVFNLNSPISHQKG